jgi:hypothetical protein
MQVIQVLNKLVHVKSYVSMKINRLLKNMFYDSKEIVHVIL